MQEVKVQSPGKLCFLLFFLQQAFQADLALPEEDRKSTRLNSSHLVISYAVFCLKKKKQYDIGDRSVWSTCGQWAQQYPVPTHVLRSSTARRLVTQPAPSPRDSRLSRRAVPVTHH